MDALGAAAAHSQAGEDYTGDQVMDTRLREAEGNTVGTVEAEIERETEAEKMQTEKEAESEAREVTGERR